MTQTSGVGTRSNRSMGEQAALVIEKNIGWTNDDGNECLSTEAPAEAETTAWILFVCLLLFLI